MNAEFSERTRRLVGEEAFSNITNAKVLIIGLGGVGSWCVEALVRAGVGALGIMDFDTVAPSNINRQLCALVSTIGRRKTDVLKERIADINPDCAVSVYDYRYDSDSSTAVNLSAYDAVVDAIDQVSSKILLVEQCAAAGVKLFSAMGGGNKKDPTRFRIADISKTEVCPLARAVRTGLRQKGINHLTTVYSPEPPITAQSSNGLRVPAGTISYVPATEGLFLAHAVITYLSNLHIYSPPMST